MAKKVTIFGEVVKGLGGLGKEIVRQTTGYEGKKKSKNLIIKSGTVTIKIKK